MLMAPSPVKSEASASPDLLSSSFPSSIQQFQFSFHSPQSHTSSEPECISNNHHNSVFRFGPSPEQSYHLMPQSWSASPGPSRQSSSGAQMLNGILHISLLLLVIPHLFFFRVDDDEDMAESGLNPSNGGKHVRRRSSKGVHSQFILLNHLTKKRSSACDQCRKSKCKCERSALGDPCKSCVMLGTRTSFSHLNIYSYVP